MARDGVFDRRERARDGELVGEQAALVAIGLDAIRHNDRHQNLIQKIINSKDSRSPDKKRKKRRKGIKVYGGDREASPHEIALRWRWRSRVSSDERLERWAGGSLRLSR